MKICSKCKVEKLKEEFYNDKAQTDGLCSSCKECKKITSKLIYAKNKEKICAYKKEYRKKNKEKIKQYFRNNPSRYRYSKAVRNLYQRNYDKNRKLIDINYKLSKNLRSRLSCAIRRNQKSGSAISDLGCSIEKFKLWIELHWKEDMSWDNYGDWHLDHKIPLSKFNLENREELLQACHFTNIQPLWAEENLSKGNRHE